MLCKLVGDELCRFLTLPSTSRSRHRMTKSGRREAARTAEVAYMLYDSLYTQRMTALTILSEKVKLAGLGASEASRIRQYERWIGDSIENLRMIKSYRTPQTLRSFTRIFATLLPPFFAPTFAQLGFTTGSLGYGITFAVITSLCLNALVEGIDILEDPFVGFVTLDGIDVREEFQVLHYQQLVTARNNLYKDEKKYGEDDKFVLSADMLDDIESQALSNQRDTSTPDTNTNNSALQLDLNEQPAPKTPRRHRTFVSFGDANLLDGIDDITSRESGYQIYGRKTRSHPFFKPPQPRKSESIELREEDNEDSSRTQCSPEIRATGPHQIQNEASLSQPQLNEDVADEENVPSHVRNVPTPMDEHVEDKDDEESAQNIQSNSDTLPRHNTSKSSLPALDSLFQPPSPRNDKDKPKNK